MDKLYGMDYEALSAFVADNNWPAYRADQIFSWCAKGETPQNMTNLPKAVRERLDILGTGGVDIMETHKSKDGSEKFLFQCEDGNAIEGILMQYSYGGSLCISTQAGCRMGCRFCASGVGGLERNLTAGEMAGQLFAITHRYGERPFNHCVLMGCGEPLDNLEEVLKFLRIVTHEEGLNLSMRNISLSTCGLVDKMDELAGYKLPLTLCISLHASDDETRRALMPIANRYVLKEVIDAARRYEQATSRRIVFEYILIRHVNDSTQDARRLCEMTRGMRKHINLIPLNGSLNGLTPPDDGTVQQFLQTLTRCGASATIRRRLGADIEGACGQLRLHTVQ